MLDKCRYVNLTSEEMDKKNQESHEIFGCFDRLRFPLIVLVIYIHNASLEVGSFNEKIQGSGWGVQNFLVDVLSNGIARIAVPLFFFMSGFLFFYRSDLVWKVYTKKIRSRVHTLLIPYLIWNSINFIFYLAAQSYHVTAPWFGGSVPILSHLNIWQATKVLLGISSLPIAYQFWFIRDLMLLVLLAPLFCIFIYNARFIVGFVLLISWLFLLWANSVPGIEPTLFFYLGSYCAIRHVPILKQTHHWTKLAVMSFAMFVFAALHLGYWSTQIAQCVAILLGLIAALGWSAKLPPQMARPLARLSRASFFIFAVHEPLVQIGRKLLYHALPMTPEAAVAIYLLLPLAIAGLALILFVAARGISPQVLAIMTGKRT